MNKLYDRIIFENDKAPALNDSNLNAMSKGIDDIDNRVLDLGTAVLETVPELERIAEDIEENLDEIKEAGAKALIAEGYSVGKQNGEDVDPDSEYYHNNAKYYSELSNPTALANLSDVDVSGATAGKVLKYNGSKWEAGEGGGGGTGSGDMLQADYDADSAVKNAGGIAEFVDSKAIELTKAEYDALPDSKLTDNKKYYISDWSQSRAQDIYDSNERVIGTWFNKPLYRKTIPITMPIISDYNTVATADIPHNISNVKNIISLYGFVGVGTVLNQIILNPTGTSTFIRANANTTNVTIQSNQKAWSQYEGYAVIEYTKTTD